MDAEFISKGPLMPRSLRGWLYFIARLMGHINAVKRGRVGRRIADSCPAALPIGGKLN